MATTPTYSSDVTIDAEAGLVDGSLTLAQHTVAVTATSVTWAETAGGSSTGSCRLSDLLSCSARDSPPRLVLSAYPLRSGRKRATRKHVEHNVRVVHPRRPLHKHFLIQIHP